LPITKGNYFSISVKHISGETIANASGQYSVAYFGGGDKINTYSNWQAVSLYNRDTSESKKKCNYNYISRFWFYIRSGVSFNNYKVKIQLEEGDTATEYQSYVDSVTTNLYLDDPLLKIDDYVDNIEFGSKKNTRNIGKFELDGTENWIFGDADKTARFYIPFSNSPITKGVQDAVLSNYLVKEEYNKRSENQYPNKIYVGGTNQAKSIQIRVDKNIIPSVEELKIYLGSLKEPLTVYNAFLTESSYDVELPSLEVPKGDFSLTVGTQIQPSKVEFTIIEKIRKL